MRNKINIPSELALVAAIIINSFSLVLMVKSHLGVSTMSSMPVLLNAMVPKISLGNWTIIIQIIYMILMCIYTHRFKKGFIVSFVVSLIYGLFVDFFTVVVFSWPSFESIRIGYFTVGLVGMSLGATLFMKCSLPILPFDLVVREISDYSNLRVKKVKILFDAFNVFLSIILGVVFLNQIVGVGIGTLICVFALGSLIQMFLKLMDEYVIFSPVSRIGKYLVRIS